MVDNDGIVIDMTQSYDWRKVWVTDDEVADMLEGIGAGIELLSGDPVVINGLKRAREIANAIKIDLEQGNDYGDDE